MSSNRFYRLFFLYVEPVFAVSGAVTAALLPDRYLEMTHKSSAPQTLPLGTLVALRQLGNLYLYFALVEALVLRSTRDINVWKTLLFCLLVADIGHLWSCWPLGSDVFQDPRSWQEPMAFGNVLFVYVGAATRLGFLMTI